MGKAGQLLRALPEDPVHRIFPARASELPLSNHQSGRRGYGSSSPQGDSPSGDGGMAKKGGRTMALKIAFAASILLNVFLALITGFYAGRESARLKEKKEFMEMHPKAFQGDFKEGP